MCLKFFFGGYSPLGYTSSLYNSNYHTSCKYDPAPTVLCAGKVLPGQSAWARGFGPWRNSSGQSWSRVWNASRLQPVYVGDGCSYSKGFSGRRHDIRPVSYGCAERSLGNRHVWRYSLNRC